MCKANGHPYLDAFTSKGAPAPQRAVQGLRAVIAEGSAPIAEGSAAIAEGSAAIADGSAAIADGSTAAIAEAERRALVGFVGLVVYRSGRPAVPLHPARGKPLKITGAMMHAFCRSGQAAAGWLLPTDSCQFPEWVGWTVQAVPAAKQGSYGHCFDTRRNPWSLGEVTSVTQMIFRDMVDNAENLTTYSWRRLCPSMAHPDGPSGLVDGLKRLARKGSLEGGDASATHHHLDLASWWSAVPR